MENHARPSLYGYGEEVSIQKCFLQWRIFWLPCFQKGSVNIFQPEAKCQYSSSLPTGRENSELLFGIEQ